MKSDESCMLLGSSSINEDMTWQELLNPDRSRAGAPTIMTADAVGRGHCQDCGGTNREVFKDLWRNISTSGL